ncbi:U2A'/phosphoprotein 32 family A C-terminal domain-containing protein [Plasmodiophora brassicae]|uniref:U2A'/phosphoprotein 32 family A C-terminal domain-containing protein n=1 Tax=Plasmodiophora brassicae TaxID=37360 RepID=A0A0G4J350_PLABS|nr:hypothetical protein PBRA_002270 [Plasmodiophora brassicae]
MTVRHRTVTDVLHEHLRLIGIEHDVLRGYRVVSQGDDVQYLQKWTSDRLYELRALLLKKECRECRSFFKGVLVFSSMCIEKMDELLVKLTQLHRLVLNDNRLKQIDCIPPELTELYACGNRITDLCATPVLASSSLVTLDLSYNAIKTIGPSALLHNVQNLNLAFNNITDLGSTISTIAAMPRLRSLRLDHNPISILFAYRQRILRAAAALETLDLVPIRPEARNQSSREPPPTPCDLTDVVLLSIRITSATHAPPELPVEDTARPNGFEERVLYHCEIRFPGQDTAMSVTNDVEADPETGTIMFNAVHEIQFRPSETWRDYLMRMPPSSRSLRLC